MTVVLAHARQAAGSGARGQFNRLLRGSSGSAHEEPAAALLFLSLTGQQQYLRSCPAFSLVEAAVRSSRGAAGSGGRSVPGEVVLNDTSCVGFFKGRGHSCCCCWFTRPSCRPSRRPSWVTGDLKSKYRARWQVSARLQIDWNTAPQHAIPHWQKRAVGVLSTSFSDSHSQTRQLHPQERAPRPLGNHAGHPLPLPGCR
jgi:hypothetical protein